MNDPFEMRLYYDKGTIENILKKTNHRSKCAVSNRETTETLLKFYICSDNTLSIKYKPTTPPPKL